MNPYKRIERLEAKIEKLQADNDRLLNEARTVDRLKRQYETKMRLAEKVQLEYSKLVVDLETDREASKSLMQELRSSVRKVGGTYKKAFKEAKHEMEI